MRCDIRRLGFGVMFGSLLLAAPCSEALALPGAAGQVDDSALAPSLVQQISHGVPAGARCVKWTRRWNTRHGFGHRRCVQWR